eukprot:TRINITY_DN6073_c0_g1_i1.p1 TRINITY_DN6073_c0_g1~~TRINITY_DN6073_c0_g1_i1.p1  ORF type:complete len:173 (+),score=50.20 TRINITY_DN6073_c0_g1_i1:64-582(+)
MQQSSPHQRMTVAGCALAAAAAAFMLTAPAEGFVAPAVATRIEAAHGPYLRSSSSRPAFEEAPAPQGASAARLLFVAGVAIAAAKGASVILRRAVPKHRSALHTTRRRRIRWCQKGERRAMQALSLAKQIKKGTANFIYGRPQDEEDYEEDDYEDDEFEDEDDDELEKKALA